MVILDGWGIGPQDSKDPLSLYNPIYTQRPNLKNYYNLINTCPHTELGAHGAYVGLTDGHLEHVGIPNDQMGNSEVGHMTIGSGRIELQELPRISQAIEDKTSTEFWGNPALLGAIEHAKKNDSALHLMGLVSEGGIHSSMHHIKGLINLAKEKGMNPKKVYVHAFLDGRDTPPQSAITYVKDINAALKEADMLPIVSISGRYYAMDRDKNWDRTQMAYDNLMSGKSYEKTSEGIKEVSVSAEMPTSAEEAIQKAYNAKITDEFILPTTIKVDGVESSQIKDNDSVIFFNFRTDRPKQLTEAITKPGFNGFDMSKTTPQPKNLNYVCMTRYDESYNLPVAFYPKKIENTLGEVVEKAGKTQLRTAETEKYAHVTKFLDGQEDKKYSGMRNVVAPSPKVKTYDLKPEMSAYEVADNVVNGIKEGRDLVVVNFANPDMVGHTGNMEATEKAVVAVDECLGKVIETAKANGYTALVTADHGNAESMLDTTQNPPVPHTQHTSNKVPFILVNAKGQKNIALKEGGGLRDIAPTILELMGLKKPDEMTGESLLKRKFYTVG